ncbi:MAG: tRNA lysidine(34) synthetase TilS [Planctomycetota bacterium]
MSDFEARVLSTLRRERMLEAGEGVVVACSGGPDSTALLLALRSLGHPAVVAHLHHGLRGAEADDDEAFVAALAARLGLPFRSAHADVRGIASAARRSIEEVGRNERYAFLERVAHAEALRAVAVGHTLDDQAETVLARLGRKSGPRGLRGILPVRPIRHGSDVRLVRPLLEVRRVELADYLFQRGQAWREDSSNRDPRFERNRIREMLRMAAPEEVEALARIAATMRGTTRVFREAALRFLEEQGSVEVPLLDAGKLLELGPPFRHEVYREVAHRLSVAAPGRMATSLIEQVLEGKGGGRDLSGGWRVELRGAKLEFRRAGLPPARGRAWWKLEVPGEMRIDELGVRVSARVEPGGLAELRARLATKGAREEWVDADRTACPYVVRLRRAGDRFHPLGAQGPQKLKKYLIDHKVPRGERGEIPIVADREGILWVVGQRIRHEARVTEATNRLLCLVVTSMA